MSHFYVFWNIFTVKPTNLMKTWGKFSCTLFIKERIKIIYHLKNGYTQLINACSEQYVNFSTRALIWVHHKILTQVSPPIQKSHWNSLWHNSVFELCHKSNILELCCLVNWLTVLYLMQSYIFIPQNSSQILYVYLCWPLSKRVQKKLSPISMNVLKNILCSLFHFDHNILSSYYGQMNWAFLLE